MAAATELRSEVPMHLEGLFRRHHQRVLRAAYRVTGSMADAEDVVQAIFLRMAHSPMPDVANVESYLYRAAINGALDLLRKRARENAVELDDALPQQAHNGPERECEAGELRAWLRQALAELDSKAAEMFVLRYVEQCDLGEIARALRTSRATVAVSLHRTRARLRNNFRTRMRGER